MERIYRHKIIRTIIVKVLIGQVRDPSGSVQLLLITVPKALRITSQLTPCAPRIKMWNTQLLED